MIWRQRVNQPRAFEAYVPNPKVCLVISPGAGWVQNQAVYETLRNSGYTVIGTWDDAYDAYRPGGRDGLNLETFVDEIMVPIIRNLIDKGNGPLFLICGPRGGQVSLNRLWRTSLQYPTICINVGLLMTTTRIPRTMRLLLTTSGQDYFPTSDYVYTNTRFGRLATGPEQQALLYHHKHDGHIPKHLASDILALVRLLIDGGVDVNLSRWAKLSILSVSSCPTCMASSTTLITALTTVDLKFYHLSYFLSVSVD